MRSLYVTLGHNSSAILVEDGKVVRGYEQERIDRKKNSSAYPAEAIDLAVKGEKVSRVMVSHWLDRFNLSENKYLNYGHLRSLGPIFELTPEFTHHDCHAQSALSFMRAHGSSDGPTTTIVLDGFGNLQECLSVYKGYDVPRIVHRTHGYHLSLGLMYQYTTEYLGLRPNRDEYKLLGYEASITDHAPMDRIDRNLRLVREQAARHVVDMIESRVIPSLDSTDLIDYMSLKKARLLWLQNARRWRELWAISDADTKAVRACVAFCAQAFIERCVEMIVGEFAAGTSNIALSGGCFLNVKLNRLVSRVVRNSYTFVNPLCGDQGAALGLDDIGWTGLAWGERSIGNIDADDLPSKVMYASRESWTKVAMSLIMKGRVVNVMRGAMEFGPRALCNTTTFALPTPQNVDRINALNDRDEAMPMAPVMTPRTARQFLDNGDLIKQYAGLPYMITTCAFSARPRESIRGVSHRDPLKAWEFTARPQVVTDDIDMMTMLDWAPEGMLINTSFNYHGDPIVFTERDAIETHVKQMVAAARRGIDPPATILVLP